MEKSEELQHVPAIEIRELRETLRAMIERLKPMDLALQSVKLEAIGLQVILPPERILMTDSFRGTSRTSSSHVECSHRAHHLVAPFQVYRLCQEASRLWFMSNNLLEGLQQQTLSI